MFGEKEIWWNAESLPPRTYICGFCDDKVSANTGFSTLSFTSETHKIYLCPSCKSPTLFGGSELQYPKPMPGTVVEGLPADIAKLYAEVRQAAGAGASTPSVLACRKLLMHLAVGFGAEAGERFVHYIDYLVSEGYVAPNSRSWVDFIRTKSNEANHEIVLMEAEDATMLLTFVEMMMRSIYEMPWLLARRQNP